MYQDGVLVLCGANANGHYWKQFLSGQFSQRRLVALSARTGEQLWACDANYRHRPVIVGDVVIAEPWGFDLRTGRQKARSHPVTGADTTWQFFRPGHHCGAISACPQMLLMRSGFTAYYDLYEDSGIRHFAGQRPGCWINAIAADGLALIPEASAGCICLYPITCSLALEPRPDHYRWGIYSVGGANTPVQRLAINFGAPGDMRDPQGKLWFAYPRPTLPSDRQTMGFSPDLQVELLPGGQYLRNETESAVPAEQRIRTSYAKGMKRCILPLRGDTDGPAQYTVRLHFPAPEGGSATRPYGVKLQGNSVAEAVDPANTSTPLEFPGVRVDRDLEIELIGPGDAAPVLSGLEVICTGTAM
jgi:hypothetical protein